MKVTRFIPLLALSLMGAIHTACSPTSESEEHHLFFQPQQSGGMVWYADQQLDTLNLVSTDSWTLTPLYVNEQPWCEITPNQHNIPPQHVSSAQLKFVFSPNTTGKVRRGYVGVDTRVSQLGSISMPFMQLPFLHIVRPHLILKSNDPAEGFHEEKISEKAGTVDMIFILYDADVNTHTLTSDAEWITVPTEAAQPKAGHNKVSLQVAENPTNQERKAHVTLTSAGVSTVATYVQKGK